MARAYKLNKSELTRLRRDMKTYNQFLPVLKLKQEQLQAEQLRLKREVAAREAEVEEARRSLDSVVPLLAEPLPVDVMGLVRAQRLRLGSKSIAGVRVPTLEEVEYPDIPVSFFGLPPWVPRALPPLRELVRQHARLLVQRRQFDLVSRELRKATQKVNLFEKVLIPETKEAIKRIRITLGDRQVAGVVRGKIAKKKTLAAGA